MKIQTDIHRSEQYNQNRFLNTSVRCLVSNCVPIIVPTKGCKDVATSLRRNDTTHIRLYVPS